MSRITLPRRGASLDAPRKSIFFTSESPEDDAIGVPDRVGSPCLPKLRTCKSVRDFSVHVLDEEEASVPAELGNSPFSPVRSSVKSHLDKKRGRANLQEMPTIRPVSFQTIRHQGRLVLREVRQRSCWQACPSAAGVPLRERSKDESCAVTSPSEEEVTSNLCPSDQAREYSAIKEQCPNGAICTTERQVSQKRQDRPEPERSGMTRCLSMPMARSHSQQLLPSAAPAGPPLAIMTEMQGLLSAMTSTIQKLKVPGMRSSPASPERSGHILTGGKRGQCLGGRFVPNLGGAAYASPVLIEGR